MTFCSITPGSQLSPYVEQVWYCKKTIAEPQRTIALPFGRMELVIAFSGEYATTNAAGRSIKNSPYWIAGQQQRAYLTTTAGDHECMGIVFTCSGWGGFTGVAADELANDFITVDAIWGHDIHSLREELFAIEVPQEKCKKLMQWIQRRLSPVKNTALIRQAMDFLASQCDTRPSVNTLCRHLKVTRKTLNQHFRQHIGLSTSVFLQQCTFNKVLKYISRSPGRRLIEGAYEHEFFDQSHFTRQFQQYAGMSPREYQEYVRMGKADSEMPNFISL